MLTRYNPIGLRYTIYADNDPNKTVISLRGKRIIVNCPLEDVSQRWFYWQMGGQFIQKAFDNLNAEEREFLITGITPSEWNEAFKDEPEDK
jgi:predicted esterase